MSLHEKVDEALTPFANDRVMTVWSALPKEVQSRTSPENVMDVLALVDPAIIELVTERDHWKANHAHEVARARILKERTDMPIERVKAYELIGELQAKLAAYEQKEQ